MNIIKEDYEIQAASGKCKFCSKDKKMNKVEFEFVEIAQSMKKFTLKIHFVSCVSKVCRFWTVLGLKFKELNGNYAKQWIAHIDLKAWKLNRW